MSLGEIKRDPAVSKMVKPALNDTAIHSMIMSLLVLDYLSTKRN